MRTRKIKYAITDDGRRVVIDHSSLALYVVDFVGGPPSSTYLKLQPPGVKSILNQGDSLTTIYVQIVERNSPKVMSK
jgi:hypothetical protein